MASLDAAGPVKFALFTCAAGDNNVVALVTAKKIRLLSMDGTVNGIAVTLQFKSGASTNLSGGHNLPPNAQKILPFNPYGWMETTAGAALNIWLGGAGAFNGELQYQEVT